MGLKFLIILVTLTLLLNVGSVIGSRRKSSRLRGQFKDLDQQGNDTNVDVNSGGKRRKGKLFSLFNVVTFRNEPCTAIATTTDGDNRGGTCYTSTECADRGGSVSGNCAAGFGVCCIFLLDGTGSTVVSENCTYIQNEGFPNIFNMMGTQTFTVNKVCDDVCFLRLDFEQFSLLGTNGSSNPDEGVCIDTLNIMTPTQMMVPEICGENTGQHIYVDIGANPGDTATITFTTGAVGFNRMWDIKINQIECSNKNRPRDSCCLQWYTGCTGRLMSFNYQNNMDNHLNNQQYSICIRQECGFCCVQYTVCPDQRVRMNGFPPGFSFDTAKVPSKSDGACVNDGVAMMRTNTRDHIAIQASGATCSPAGGDCDRAINNRYCGGHLNHNQGVMKNVAICDCTAPFTVDVFFNSVNDKDGAVGNSNAIQSRGFCLEYMQVPC